MDTNRANMNTLFTTFNMSYQKGFNQAPAKHKAFTMEFPSSTSIQSYPFLNLFGGMKEWLSARQLNNIKSEKVEVSNKTFEDSVSIKREEIEDDQFGLYSPIFEQLGYNAEILWQELAIKALLDNGNWLDGKPYFDATRKYGTNDVINKTALALSEASFDEAYTTMMTYKGHNGKILANVPSLLVVPPQLRKTALNIVKNGFAYDAVDKVQLENMNKGICDVLVLESLAVAPKNWYLMNSSGIIKPVANQVRKRASGIVRKDKDTDDNVFNDNVFNYGVDARGTGFLTIPHLAYAGIVA